jgi:hypothetical protein
MEWVKKLTGIPITGQRVENRGSVCQRHGDGLVTSPLRSWVMPSATQANGLSSGQSPRFGIARGHSYLGLDRTKQTGCRCCSGSFARIRSLEVSGLPTGISVIVK